MERGRRVRPNRDSFSRGVSREARKPASLESHASLFPASRIIARARARRSHSFTPGDLSLPKICRWEDRRFLGKLIIRARDSRRDPESLPPSALLCARVVREITRFSNNSPNGGVLGARD